MRVGFVNTFTGSAHNPMALELSVKNLAFFKLWKSKRRNGQKDLQQEAAPGDCFSKIPINYSGP